MTSRRTTALLFAALLSVASQITHAPEAAASAVVGVQAERYVESEVARTTARASREWARFPGLRAQFQAAMQSPNATYRYQAKRYADQWIVQMQRLLADAITTHNSALNMLAGSSPYSARGRWAQQLVQRRNEMQAIYRNLTQTRYQIRRMR